MQVIDKRQMSWGTLYSLFLFKKTALKWAAELFLVFRYLVVKCRSCSAHCHYGWVLNISTFTFRETGCELLVKQERHKFVLMKGMAAIMQETLPCSFSIRFHILFILLTGLKPNISSMCLGQNNLSCDLLDTTYILYFVSIHNCTVQNVGIYSLLLMLIFCLAVSGVFSRLVGLITSPEHTEPLSTTLSKVFCKFSVSATRILRLYSGTRESEGWPTCPQPFQ